MNYFRRIILKKLFFTALIITLYLPGSAYAEDTNSPEETFHLCDIFEYEHPVKKGEDEKKWSSVIAGSYIRKTGNTDTRRTNYSASIQYDDNITSFKAVFAGFYGETLDIPDENRGSITANYDRYLLWKMELFSYSTSEYNKITGLIHRNESGAGLKYVFIRNRYLLIDLSAAPILQYEKYEDVGPERD